MDSVFQYVGTCGLFQLCHVFCVQMIRVVNAWCVYLMVFGNYEPAWECIQYGRALNTTINNTDADGKYTYYAGYQDSGAAKEQRSALNESAGHAPRLSNSTTPNDTAAIISHQGTCDRLHLCDEVRFDPASVTLVTEFELICDRAFIPSIVIAIQMLGMLFGCYLGGQLAESLGRKVNIYASLAVMASATFVAAWSVSWQMHAALAFFIGVGSGGIVASHIVYAMEFLSAKWRGRFATIPTWNLSLIVFAVMIIGLKNYHHVHILTGAVAGSVLLGALWVPESLRWLYVHGKEPEAKRVIEKMMKLNKRKENVDLVLSKLNDMKKDDGRSTRKYNYLDLFRNKRIRNLAIKASIVWFVTGMSYFTMGFSVKALSGDYYTNLFLSNVSEIPFVFLVAPCINRIGRKVTVSVFMCLGTVCTIACVIAYYVTSYEVSGPAIKYLAIIGKAFASTGWTAFSIFTIELFPTVVRTLAAGFFNTIGRIGAMVGTSLIPRDQGSLVICFAVLSVAMLLACVLVLSLPETKGKPLQDEIEDEPCQSLQTVAGVNEVSVSLSASGQ